MVSNSNSCVLRTEICVDWVAVVGDEKKEEKKDGGGRERGDKKGGRKKGEARDGIGRMGRYCGSNTDILLVSGGRNSSFFKVSLVPSVIYTIRADYNSYPHLPGLESN